MVRAVESKKTWRGILPAAPACDEHRFFGEMELS
jgi:hypothetical protein